MQKYFPLSKSVVEKILPIFLAEGISTNTIQVLAKKANISTKTIYKNFENKEQLLVACLEAYYEKFLYDIRTIFEGNNACVPSFLEATAYVLAQEFSINKSFFTDLNQNFRDIQDDVLQKIHPKFPELSVGVLKAGITQGSVQEDTIPELFMMAYARLYHSITREETYNATGYNTMEILENTLYALIKGILTERGLKEYLEFRKNFT